MMKVLGCLVLSLSVISIRSMDVPIMAKYRWEFGPGTGAQDNTFECDMTITGNGEWTSDYDEFYGSSPATLQTLNSNPKTVKVTGCSVAGTPGKCAVPLMADDNAAAGQTLTLAASCQQKDAADADVGAVQTFTQSLTWVASHIGFPEGQEYTPSSNSLTLFYTNTASGSSSMWLRVATDDDAAGSDFNFWCNDFQTTVRATAYRPTTPPGSPAVRAWELRSQYVTDLGSFFPVPVVPGTVNEVKLQVGVKDMWYEEVTSPASISTTGKFWMSPANMLHFPVRNTDGMRLFTPEMEMKLAEKVYAPVKTIAEASTNKMWFGVTLIVPGKAAFTRTFHFSSHYGPVGGTTMHQPDRLFRTASEGVMDAPDGKYDSLFDYFAYPGGPVTVFLEYPMDDEAMTKGYGVTVGFNGASAADSPSQRAVYINKNSHVFIPGGPATSTCTAEFFQMESQKVFDATTPSPSVLLDNSDFPATSLHATASMTAKKGYCALVDLMCTDANSVVTHSLHGPYMFSDEMNVGIVKDTVKTNLPLQYVSLHVPVGSAKFNRRINVLYDGWYAPEATRPNDLLYYWANNDMMPAMLARTGVHGPMSHTQGTKTWSQSTPYFTIPTSTITGMIDRLFVSVPVSTGGIPAADRTNTAEMTFDKLDVKLAVASLYGFETALLSTPSEGEMKWMVTGRMLESTDKLKANMMDARSGDFMMMSDVEMIDEAAMMMLKDGYTKAGTEYVMTYAMQAPRSGMVTVTFEVEGAKFVEGKVKKLGFEKMELDTTKMKLTLGQQAVTAGAIYYLRLVTDMKPSLVNFMAMGPGDMKDAQVLMGAATAAPSGAANLSVAIITLLFSAVAFFLH